MHIVNMICGKAVDCVCKCKKSSIVNCGNFPLFFCEDCRVAAVAVEVLSRRESDLFSFEYKITVFLKEVFDKVAVFIFLNTASAVADYSVGFEH